MKDSKNKVECAKYRKQNQNMFKMLKLGIADLDLRKRGQSVGMT